MTEQTKKIEELDAQIEALKEELKDVHGTETEVYARIVGYYRAVKNWNKGKRAEFHNRKLFTVDETIYNETEPDFQTSNSSGNCTTAEEGFTNAAYAPLFSKVELEQTGSSETQAPEAFFEYEFFMRKTCPNCPPVKAFMEELPLEGTVIDVDTDEGLRQAAAKGVFSAPTVIFYDQQGTELSRAHSVEDIKAALPQTAVAL